MSLLGIPTELRLRIYHYCFPSPGTTVQIIPYVASSSSCHLKLPLSLYLVCKKIYTELPELKSKLRQLNLTYLAAPNPATSGLKDKDNNLERTLQFAERLRVVGTEWPLKFYPPKMLFPGGSECQAVTVVELQLANWSLPAVVQVLGLCWPVLSNANVKGRLEIILSKKYCILENDKSLHDIKVFLRKINQIPNV